MDQGGMTAKEPLSENEKRRLVLRLIGQLSCAECGRRFDPHDFTLVHRWKDLWVLGTRCRHCNEASHVVVFMRLDAEVEPVTDLTPDELEGHPLRRDFPLTYEVPQFSWNKDDPPEVIK